MRRLPGLLAAVIGALAFVTLTGGTGAAPAPFKTIDLGVIGGSSSTARAISDDGQVVGESTFGAGSTVHPFAWTRDGGMIDLGTLGGVSGTAVAVNEAGQVAGDSATAAQRTHAFVWTPANGMLDLGTLGGNDSHATALSANGRVVGYSDTASGQKHAFSWTAADGMVDLGSLGGVVMVPPFGDLGGSFARAVNESGQVVGYSIVGVSSGSTIEHAFSWTPGGGMVDLGTLGGSTASAEDVNESGQVVGDSLMLTAGRRAFSWTKTGGMVSLGTITGRFSSAWHVNDAGQVLGSSEAGLATSVTHPFVWTPGKGMADVGVSISDVPRAINNAGQAVGQGFLGNTASAWSWTAADGLSLLGPGDARDVNGSGDVVGVAPYVVPTASGFVTRQHATLWRRTNLPTAPGAVSAVAGDAQATVSFEPSGSGTSTILYYTVATSEGGQSQSGTGSPITVAGLENGSSYSFTVTATSTAGEGSPSAPSNAIVPAGHERPHPEPPVQTERAPVPDAPATSRPRPRPPGH